MRIEKNLEIYGKSFELSIDIERLLRKEKVKAPVATPLRRSINSVSDNIAEGCAYDSDKVMRRHCRIALGSLIEAQTQTLRLIRLGDIPDSNRPLIHRFDGLRRQIQAFIEHLNRKIDGEA